MIKKRYTVKHEHPNQLFEEWLREWRDTAIETNSKMQYCYNKALQSLQKYPLLLPSGRDCIILQGFGEKLCKMLDEKLAEHKNSRISEGSAVTTCDQTQRIGTSNKTSHRAIKHRDYCPALRSGSWAILLTLYKKSLEPQYPGFMFKPEIIKIAQNLCDTSFIKPDPGSYYTAWSSMKTLLDKNLVVKFNSPAKFSLTDHGRLLASKLHTSSVNENGTLVENRCNNTVSPDILVNKSITPTKLKAVVSSTFSSIQSSSSSTLQNIVQELEHQTESYSPYSSLSQEETLICTPNSFDIILLVDKMEVSGNRHCLDDTTLSELTKLNVTYEVRHLKVGDYTWICRERSTNKELVLPYIVERKRMDDFGKSIKDGRFHEQKFRLKQCGITNVIYLVESFGNNTYTGLPLKTLDQAAINTLIHDGFSVKFTDNTKATIKYFAFLTNILKNLYMGKTLVSCPKETLPQAINDDDLVSLMSFHEFNREASKNKNLTVRDMFVRLLVQLKGMSVEKALAIVEKYPTPQILRLSYSKNTADSNKMLLANLEYGKLRRKIGSSISKIIYQLFTGIAC